MDSRILMASISGLMVLAMTSVYASSGSAAADSEQLVYPHPATYMAVAKQLGTSDATLTFCTGTSPGYRSEFEAQLGAGNHPNIKQALGTFDLGFENMMGNLARIDQGCSETYNEVQRSNAEKMFDTIRPKPAAGAKAQSQSSRDTNETQTAAPVISTATASEDGGADSPVAEPSAASSTLTVSSQENPSPGSKCSAFGLEWITEPSLVIPVNFRLGVVTGWVDVELGIDKAGLVYPQRIIAAHGTAANASTDTANWTSDQWVRFFKRSATRELRRQRTSPNNTALVCVETIHFVEGTAETLAHYPTNNRPQVIAIQESRCSKTPHLCVKP